MLNHKQAREVVAQAAAEIGLKVGVPGLQLLQAVGLMETSYSSGWKEGQGRGSHNWGAVQKGSWTGATFQTIDTRPSSDGTSTEYIATFRAYPSDLEGAKDMIRIATRTEQEKAALVAGDLDAFSAALYAARYYEGHGKTPEERVANHQAWLLKGAKQIAKKSWRASRKKKKEYLVPLMLISSSLICWKLLKR